MMMKTMKMIMKKNIDQLCSICGANSDLTEYHLIPKSIQNRKKIKNTNKEEVTGKTIPLCFTIVLYIICLLKKNCQKIFIH